MKAQVFMRALGGFYLPAESDREGCSGNKHTSSLDCVSTRDPLEKISGKKNRWRCSCVRGTLVFCVSRSNSASSWRWGVLGSLLLPCRAAPLLKSSQNQVISDAVLISSLRRGLKTEVAQWSDTLSMPLSWAISGHGSLAGPCTKPYKPLLLLRVLFAIQPLHLHISHSHILLYIFKKIWNHCWHWEFNRSVVAAVLIKWDILSRG